MQATSSLKVDICVSLWCVLGCADPFDVGVVHGLCVSWLCLAVEWSCLTLSWGIRVVVGTPPSTQAFADTVCDGGK